jgi:hypothetical protein
MKKDFENNKALDELFGGFKSVDEIEKEKETETKEAEKEVVEVVKETPKEKKPKKEKEETGKKATLFTEVDSVVTEYLDLMTFITGQTKKEYINELVKNDIKSSLNISETATDEQIHRAIENKKKELQKLFRRPSK